MIRELVFHRFNLLFGQARRVEWSNLLDTKILEEETNKDYGSHTVSAVVTK